MTSWDKCYFISPQITTKTFFTFQNLDVNLAVNNLLSRDEDDGDDDENPEYLPGGKSSNEP